MITRIRTKETHCGDFLYISVMPVMAQPKSKRKRRFKPTRESMVEYNRQKAALWLQQVAETNFTDEDYCIHLTYDGKHLPKDDQEAMHRIDLYVRRLQYHSKKNGLSAPVVIWNTEKGQRNGRYHHHVILKCALSRDKIEKLWKQGKANADRLQFDENGLAGLINYIQKFKSRVGVRRWHSTNNLKKPIQCENDRISKKNFYDLYKDLEMSNYFKRKYPNYYINHDSVKRMNNDINGCDYLFFKAYRSDVKQLNHMGACRSTDKRKAADRRKSRPLNYNRLQ